MKKLVFGLIATVMFGFVGNAQVTKATLEKTYGPLTLIDLPSEIVTTEKSTFEQVIPKVNKSGTILLVCNEYGLKSMYATTGVKLPSNYREVLKASFTTINQGGTVAGRQCGFWCWLRILINGLCEVFPCDPV